MYKAATGEVETLQHFQLDSAEETHNGALDLGGLVQRSKAP